MALRPLRPASAPLLRVTPRRAWGRGRSGSTRRPPPHFTDAQEEQQLWEELRSHDASLNQALKEALRIHGGPAWRVFQVRQRSLACRFLPCSVVFTFVFAVRRSLVFVY
jgi:hypothetical protein